MKIHKIDAARRLLDTAISLFFSNDDACSIISLAAAAEELLGNYVDGRWVKNNENNIFHRIYEEADSRELPYKNKKEFSQRLVNKTKNFLKHANNAEEQYVIFDEDEPVIRLKHALINYQTGSGRQFSDAMVKFESWLRDNRQQYITVAPEILWFDALRLWTISAKVKLFSQFYWLGQ